MGVNLLSPIGVPVTPRDFDVRVTDDQPTLQAADDAQGDRPYTMVVRDGTYAGDLTVASDCVLIFFEPASDLDGTLIMSGDNIALVIGGGSDLDELITLSGASDSLRCLNGVALDGIVASGDFGFIGGGGWGTLTIVTSGVALTLSGDDCIARNLSVQTPTGGAAGDAATLSGARCNLIAIKVDDADDDGLRVDGTGTDALILACALLGSDSRGISQSGPRCRIVGTFIVNAGGDGILIGSTGDNSVVVGCIIQDQVGDSIELNALAEDCVVAGNRLDGAVNDASGTSTVGDNLTTAF